MPKDGKPLWHTRVGNISNAPQTYAIDGKQYLLVATGDMLWAFTSVLTQQTENE